jgi:hypothetical protein
MEAVSSNRSSSSGVMVAGPPSASRMLAESDPNPISSGSSGGEADRSAEWGRGCKRQRMVECPRLPPRDKSLAMAVLVTR